MSKMEIVQYNHVQGMSVFFNMLEYRTAHFHQDWELIWVVENSLKISAESETFVAKRGDLVLFPPSAVHEFQAVEGTCVSFCIQMSPQFINLNSSFSTSSFHPLDYLNSQDCSYIKKMLLDILDYYLRQPKLYQLICAGYSNLVMHRILSKMPSKIKTGDEMNIQNRKNERLNHLIEFVNNNYMHKVLLSDFARQEGLTMNYLSHFFKDNLNQSFQTYLNTVRFHAACKLIAEKKAKLTDIYKMTGFSDYKYFSKTFKEHCGMSAEEYSNRIDREDTPNRQIQRISIDSSERILTLTESLALIEKEKKAI